MSAKSSAIPRCATCRFWSEKPAYSGQKDSRYCRHPALAKSYEWPFDDETANGGGDSYGMVTGANFGCPHHEGTC